MPSLDLSRGSDEGVSFVAVTVGNTRTRVGRFDGDSLSGPRSLPSGDAMAIAEAVRALAARGEGAASEPTTTVVIASVNPPAARAIEQALGPALTIARIGPDLPIPLAMDLSDTSTVGQDRLLCALAAWTRAKSACVVIDAGTAVTVDFVDGTGVFQGGAILPGVRMMLASLRAGTASLPEIAFEPAEEPGPFGKDTRGAMLLGVRSAIRGAVRELVDAYALAYEGYPPVVATGGDAELLVHEGGLVEHIVPDLQLMGVQAAVAAALEAEDD